MANTEFDGSNEKANWNDTNTKHFISAALTQVRQGNRPGANLNSVGFTLTTREFNNLSKLNYSIKQIRTKWENMRKEWVLWKKLKQDTGMGWVYEGGTITASEDWWQKKKAENKEYYRFRHRGPVLPDEQEEMFGSTVATGNFSMTSADIPPSHDPILRLTGHDIENLETEYQGSVHELLGLGSADEEATQNAVNYTPPVSALDKKKRKSNHLELSRSITNLNDTVSAYVAHTASSTHTEKYTIQACIEEMDRIEEVSADPSLYVNGLFLFKDPVYREMFILTKQVDKKIEFLRRGGEK